MTLPDKFELHLTVEQENQTAVELITSGCKLSNQQIKQAIHKGALWLTKGKSTQRLRRIKKPLVKGAGLHFYYDPTVLSQTVENAVLIEDCQQYSIWYKPYGMLSQGSKWSDHCTIARFVEQYFNNERPAFIVHRLDRAASGLIIIAHGKKIAKTFSQIFEQRLLDKHYQIICHGKLDTNNAHVVTEPIDDKSAKSTFSLADYAAEQDISLIDVKIDSGRKHQIRKHAALINLPVVGDRLHGDKTKSYDDSLNLQLCAVKLSFQCPINNQAKLIYLDKTLCPQLDKVAQALTKNSQN